ncbi:MAG: PepSY-associated TM helix domain-containing protein [Burkholderiales bacterium]|nr:PepSY-associated TM helix domain-containing protein [Burkholderiales bacterium]
MIASTAPAARRSLWLKTLHQWHWISSALCLTGMLLFALTGITLNHASDIEARPVVSNRTAELPAELLSRLKQAGTNKSPLPPSVRDWLSRELDLKLGAAEAEWSADEIYLAMPRPGGDAWLRIERSSGAVEYERTDRGWISYLNDLHKGRHTGIVWSWFIDIFSVACLIFSITGLLILKFHAANRSSTWPLVGAGLVAPLLLAILFIH